MKKKVIVTLLGILIVLFGIPHLINFIVTTPSAIGFITVDQQETWINFYGAVIGGTITLLGVAWTIQHTNSIREQDQKNRELEIQNEHIKRDQELKRNLSVQYKPILITAFNPNYLFDDPYGMSTYKEHIIQNHILLSDEKIDGKRIALSFLILNIGRGEAHDIKIRSSIVSPNMELWRTNPRDYGEICTSNGISINFYHTLSDEEWKAYEHQKLDTPVSVHIKIEYCDLVGYKHCLDSAIKINEFMHVYDNNGTMINNVLFVNPAGTIIVNTTSSTDELN